MTDRERMQYAERVLLEIRTLSNYPGKGRSTFQELADKRRRINNLACRACDVLHLQDGTA